jgi:hypothetical protein
MKTESKMDAAAKNQLINEFTNAWEHYRHNENMRLQYLQYFITVSLALFSGTGYLLLNKEGEKYILFIEIIFFVYSFVSMFIYQSIKKINYVGMACEQVFDQVREKLIGDDILQLVRHRFYLKNMDPKNDTLPSVSQASENIVRFMVIFGFLGLLAIDFFNGIFCNWFSLAGIFVTLTKMAELIIIFKLFGIKKKIFKEKAA